LSRTDDKDSRDAVPKYVHKRAYLLQKSSTNFFKKILLTVQVGAVGRFSVADAAALGGCQKAW
jgi:hypothetical protein